MPAVGTANKSGKMTSFDKVILIKLKEKTLDFVLLNVFMRISGTCRYYVEGILSFDVIIFYLS